MGPGCGIPELESGHVLCLGKEPVPASTYTHLSCLHFLTFKNSSEEKLPALEAALCPYGIPDSAPADCSPAPCSAAVTWLEIEFKLRMETELRKKNQSLM